MGETLADWCYSVRPGQKSSTSLSTPRHLLQVEGIQWILRQREGMGEPGREREPFLSEARWNLFSVKASHLHLD